MSTQQIRRKRKRVGLRKEDKIKGQEARETDKQRGGMRQAGNGQHPRETRLVTLH